MGLRGEEGRLGEGGGIMGGRGRGESWKGGGKNVLVV